MDRAIALSAAALARVAIQTRKNPVKPSEKPNTYGLPTGTPIKRKLKALFARQAKYVLGLIPSIGAPLPDSLPALSIYDPAAAEVMAPTIGAYWSIGGKAAYARLGLDENEWKVTNPYLRQKIQSAAFAFCKSTNATTDLKLSKALAALKSELTKGLIEEGESIPELTKRVNKVFKHASKYRANLIARAEASRAVHAAQLEADKASGVVWGLEWLVSANGCPLCKQIASEVKQVQLGQAFATIGSHPDYSSVKHPPAHPLCRCSCVEVLKPTGDEPEPQGYGTLDQPDGSGYEDIDGPAPAPEKLQ